MANPEYFQCKKPTTNKPSPKDYQHLQISSLRMILWLAGWQSISTERETFCDGVFSIFHMTFKLIKPALLLYKPNRGVKAKQKDKTAQPYLTKQKKSRSWSYRTTNNFQEGTSLTHGAMHNSEAILSIAWSIIIMEDNDGGAWSCHSLHCLVSLLFPSTD